jgi:hypothetical protein
MSFSKGGAASIEDTNDANWDALTFKAVPRAVIMQELSKGLVACGSTNSQPINEARFASQTGCKPYSSKRFRISALNAVA